MKLLFIAILMCSALVTQAQTEWTKRTVASSLSVVTGPTSMINGFIVVGQPVVGEVLSSGRFGWIGLLPITQTVMPLSVDEDPLPVSFKGQIVSLDVSPNPADGYFVLHHHGLVDVRVVRLIDEFGRTTLAAFQILENYGLLVWIDGVASGAYTIVVSCDAATGIGRVVALR